MTNNNNDIDGKASKQDRIDALIAMEEGSRNWSQKSPSSLFYSREGRVLSNAEVMLKTFFKVVTKTVVTEYLLFMD